MSKVSIITVNYNQKKITEELIFSIVSIYNYELIVIDNGSADNPIPEWEEKYTDVIFIRSDSNLGFAGGNNLGISHATGDYIFFVNNDTIFTHNLLERLIDTMNTYPIIGMISPKIKYYDEPDLIQYAGFTDMNYYTCRNSCIGQYEKDKGQYDKNVGATGYIHGAAMMVRKSAIEKVGVMAENFFLYYEEFDWNERIKKAGYEIWIDCGTFIYHRESVSVGKNSPLKEYFMNRNRWLFIRKNGSVLARIIFPIYFCTVVVPRNLFTYLKNKHYNLVIPLLKSIIWNISHSTSSIDTGYKTK